MTPRELLAATADAFESGAMRWGQGPGLHSRQCECAVTGLVAVSLGHADDHLFFISKAKPAETILAETVLAETGHTGIVQWNDAPGRTLGQVVAMFRKAAEA